MSIGASSGPVSPSPADAATPVEAAAAAASPTWAVCPLTGGLVDAPNKRKAEDDLAEDAHPRGLKKPKVDGGN